MVSLPRFTPPRRAEPSAPRRAAALHSLSAPGPRRERQGSCLPLDIRHQRYWVHETEDVLGPLPKSAQPTAKRALQEIDNGEGRGAFLSSYIFQHPPWLP